MEIKQTIIVFSVLACSISVMARENELPAVQVNGEFYSYAEAARGKGAKVSANGDGTYTITNFGKKYLVEANGRGLNSASAALFPTSVLVQFKFKKTIKLGKTLVNDRGPIPSINIDNDGNGEGSAYIDPKEEEQSIEVRGGNKSATGKFLLKEKRKVECKGKDRLACSSS